MKEKRRFGDSHRSDGYCRDDYRSGGSGSAITLLIYR